MERFGELEKAQLKVEFKQMYNNVGLEGSLQVVYELLFSTNTLLEVINEQNKEGMEPK